MLHQHLHKIFDNNMGTYHSHWPGKKIYKYIKHKQNDHVSRYSPCLPFAVQRPIQDDEADSIRRLTLHPLSLKIGLTCLATVARSVRATSGLCNIYCYHNMMMMNDEEVGYDTT